MTQARQHKATISSSSVRLGPSRGLLDVREIATLLQDARVGAEAAWRRIEVSATVNASHDPEEPRAAPIGTAYLEAKRSVFSVHGVKGGDPSALGFEKPLNRLTAFDNQRSRFWQALPVAFSRLRREARPNGHAVCALQSLYCRQVVRFKEGPNPRVDRHIAHACHCEQCEAI